MLVQHFKKQQYVGLLTRWKILA